MTPLEFDEKAAIDEWNETNPLESICGKKDWFIEGARWQFSQLKPIIDKQAEAIKVLREHLERVLDLSEAEISYDWTQFKDAREALETVESGK